MNSLKISARRAGSVFAAAALVLATALPGLASAATVTERSVALSNSAPSAQNVTYNVSFNAGTTTTGAFAIDFCTTPEIGTACTTPTDMTIGTIGTDSAHTVTEVDDNTVKVVLDTPVNSGATVTVDIKGVNNTSTVGPFYARIVTYTDGTTNYGYQSATDLDGTSNDQDPLDDGTVAISIANGFGVNGAVLEQLTFCVSGEVETDCSAPTVPVVSLGTNGVLNNTAGADGNVYSYIATNAVSGAVVNLKSSTTGCGGLLRDGAGTAAQRCGIAPLKTGVATIADNSAAFGAKLTLTQPAGAAGQLNLVGNWGANYYMNFDDDGTENTGVTSPYGDTIYNTNNAPTEFGGGQLSFNANTSNLTPAGNYSANFSMIATGKF